MGHLRAIGRVATLSALALVLYVVFLAGLPFTGRWGTRGHRWRVRLWRAWSRATLRLLRVRVDVRGEPPRPPFVLVANHLGYIDIPLLATLVEGVFVSRADVRSWPFVGYFGRAIGTLFLDRADKKAIRQVVEGIGAKLRHGVGVVFFPEGTSSPGEEVLPFRPALLEAAIMSQAPVSFAVLAYQTIPGDPPASESICWWGEMTFPRHAYRLFGLRGFRAQVAFGDEPVREADRKALAERLHREVQVLHRGLCEGEAS